MQLLKFRVTEFRSVLDSGWIDVESITALIGTNESGKTNILLPLWKLNPADDGAINLQDDLPRDKYHEYRNADPMPTFITAVFTLEDKEKTHLANLTNFDTENFSTVQVSRDFAGKYLWAFPDADEKPITSVEELNVVFDQYIQSISTQGEVPKAEMQRRGKVTSAINLAKEYLRSEKSLADELTDALKELDKVEISTQSSSSFTKLGELKQLIKEKIEALSTPMLSENTEVKEYLESVMPKYVYYSNYGNLDSQIYLPQVLQNLTRDNLGLKEAAKARTLRTLFKFVSLDPAEITQMGADPQGNPSPAEIEKIANKKKEREILLSSASSAFTKAFNEWWKQGDYTFEFQADGDFFRIWVADKIRPERIELEARSTGLQWFFSFYLVFLVESEAHHQNAVLLLDEPGVTLHPLAQKNLFEFFESLGEKNQMIYTTHSPFMVDSDHLERVRSVYVDKNGKTVVSSNLRASEQTHGVNQSQSIYPAHAALGLTVSDTLLINCKPVLVEGESDQLYLSALKNLLISLGKITPLRDLVFIPTGGVKGIKATSSIIASKADERPFVIVDGDIPGQKMKKELLADFYAADADKIIDISDYTSISNGEIEDLFPLERMARIVSKFLPRPEEAEDEFEDIVEDEKPLCNQIEEFAKAQNIPLVRGWKVQLASTIKKEILRGKGKVIKEEDKEFSKVEGLFKRILS